MLTMCDHDGGFVEIITDEGITGWGEAVLEGHCDAVLACVQEYRSYLIGQDPFRIEDISATIFSCWIFIVAAVF